MLEGTAQGETSSTPAFSRGLRLALEAATEQAEAQGIWLHTPSLVDDMMLVCTPERFERALQLVATHCQQVLGCQLNLDKCKVYLPARSAAGLGPHPAINSIEQVQGGLPALGAAYGGAYEAVLGPFSVAAGPARKRLEVATQAAKECAAYAHEVHKDSTRQAAWTMLRQAVSKALTYDVRTLEPHESRPLCQELDRLVGEAAAALLAPLPGAWSVSQIMQLSWPADLSGMGCSSAAVAARIGRIACLAQCLPTARDHLRRILPEASEAEILNAVPLDGACAEMQALKEEYGIEISQDGNIASGAEPRLDLRQRFRPLRGLMGLLSREVYVRERAKFLRECAEVASCAASTRQEREKAKRTVARIHSCEGGAGRWVEATPSRESLRLTDAEFTFGARWRLGLPVCNCETCGQRNKGQDSSDSHPAEERCGRLLDVYGDHAVTCRKGGGFYRAHGSVARALAAWARECDAEVYAEVVVPELLMGTPGSDEAVEARLDLHIWGASPHLCEWFVDTTVVHPWALRYQDAWQHAGHAGAAAEAKKYERYGNSSGGIAVIPAAVESFGRMGASFTALMRQLEARWACVHRRNAADASTTGRRWLADLGVALVRAQTLTVRLANRPVRITSPGEASDSD